MKNQIDLLKIRDGLYGVINFNNMIPVHKNSVTEIVFAVSASDSPAERAYKALLSNQLTWCNANRDSILSKAQKLYYLISSRKGWDSLTARCCDFPRDEDLLRRYCILMGWT